GSGIIKLVVIDHGGSEPELSKVATTEVAADAIVEGEVMDPGLVSEAIRGLFDAAGVKRKSVVTAVGGRDVIVKKIQMDRMEEAEKVIQGASQNADLAGYVNARGEEIAVGVERAAAFLATASRSAGGLSRVYTTGGGARIPGLNDVLGARLKVPIELANPVQR